MVMFKIHAIMYYTGNMQFGGISSRAWRYILLGVRTNVLIGDMPTKELVQCAIRHPAGIAGGCIRIRVRRSERELAGTAYLRMLRK